MIEDERVAAMEDLHKKGDEGHQVVIMPQYMEHPRYKVDVEDTSPPKEIFLGLGWDEDRLTQRKHYRQYYPDELENIKEIFPQ